MAAAVLVADTFFLAMFLGAAAIEATSSPPALSYAFAAQWRHGMAGNSPLYMPGFFAAAVAMWFWSMDKTVGRTLGERAALLVASLGLATLTAPYTADLALRSFHDHTGTAVAGSHETPMGLASFQGVYTLVAWSTFVIGSRIAIERRSLKPLAPALVANMLLVVVRPWTVDEFASFWWRRMLEGDLTAVFSSALVVVTAGALATSELADERRPRRRYLPR
jgi:hypothetical protein